MGRWAVRGLFLLMLICVSAEASGLAGLKGTYKCSGYNISGAGYNVTGIGGSCHFSAPLILKPNGTYHMVPEHGRYKISGDLIHLSESKFRGPGKIRSDGAMITFDYEYMDKHYFITYTCEDCIAAEPSPPPAAFKENKIQVDLLLRFKKETGLFSWVNEAYLVPQANAEKYMRNKSRTSNSAVLGSSRQVTRNVVSVGFQSVDTGKKYVVFLDSYGSLYPVAILDLTHAQKSMAVDLNASLSMDLKSLKRSNGTPRLSADGKSESREKGGVGGKLTDKEPDPPATTGQ